VFALVALRLFKAARLFGILNTHVLHLGSKLLLCQFGSGDAAGTQPDLWIWLVSIGVARSGGLSGNSWRG
jgi:hypothetical protein